MNARVLARRAGAAPLKRQRNAAATRHSILESALIAFTRSGYDGVGVREIARGAGVTAMLVNRYFGSKERLFAEVVDAALAKKGILTDEVTMQSRDLATLSQDVAAALVARTAPEAVPLPGFLVMLRSAANERAAAIWRDKIEQHFEKPLAGLLPGPRAKERAALFVCLIAGFQVMRQVVGISALAGADAASLSRQLASLFQLLVDPGMKETAAGREPARAGRRERHHAVADDESVDAGGGRVTRGYRR